MDQVMQAQVLKVRKFSRYARVLCIPLFVFLGLVALLFAFTLLTGVAGPGSKVALGAFTIHPERTLPPGLKAWAVLVLGAIMTLLFKGLYHLYSLFGHFMNGNIYTKDSVREIRNIGLVTLYLPLVMGAMTGISWLLLQTGLVDAALVTRESIVITPGTFSAFITPALILLASWIMEVGRQTHEEADRMRREAELVV